MSHSSNEGVTETLAAYVVGSTFEGVPRDVHAEAKRAIVNYLGCALGGSIEPALDVAIETLAPFSGERNASVLGRGERFDALHAALLNGIGSHVHEYDDTLPKNYIHPSVPVASALFAYASANPVSGRDFVHAFILGFEVESRIGNAVYPAHYTAGWHITSTTGVFGAAAAIGKLLKLSTRQMVWAFGLAATQAAGLREMFGSMAKSFQPGRAAQNGYTAALLGRADFTAGERALESPRGFAAVTAAHYDLGKVTEKLGESFDLRDNAYKPYACGLVVHPAIDGCSQLHREFRPAPESIDAVRVRVAPLVLDLCNKKDLRRALESKYSIYHAAAIGLVRGKGGLQEFTDDAIADPALAHVRSVTTAVADPAITEDQVHIEVTLKDGRKLVKFVEQSLGNVHRPLSNEQITEKFVDQAVLALPRAQVDAVVEQSWRVDELADVGELARDDPAAHGFGVRARHARARVTRAVSAAAARLDRRAVPAALALLAAALLAGCGSGGADGHAIRIPLGAGGVGFLPLLVMKERGLIEKHAAAAGEAGVSVRWIELGGPAVMNDALLSGSVDFIAAGPPAFITLWDRTRDSADIRGVAAMSSLPMYLNTTAEHIKTLEDLTPQDKIAVTSVKVSIPSINMQMYATERYGAAEAYRFDRFTVTMTHADAVVALLAGGNQIDAHFTSPPFHQREIKDPRVHTVLDTDAIMNGATTFTMLSTTAKYRDQNPVLYEAVLAALDEANELIRSDPQTAAEILFAAEATAGFSVEELVEVLRDPAIKFTTTPENVRKYAAFMHEIGSIEHLPESWRDLFFPEIHGSPGS